MASLICPNCGKDNPDFLDNCQFCQTALRREAKLNIGEGPTKKSTGELEGVLPDWLKEARQQSRELAEEEAAKEATKPKIQKAEPPDLLAGLAFQAASDEDEVPDWLSAINPVADKKAPSPSQPAQEEPPDFFAQFNQPAQQPVAPASDETPAWMSGLTTSQEPQKDELADLFSQPGVQSFGFEPGAFQEPPAPAAPTEPEDLSWLRDLESSSKPPSAPEPQSGMDWATNVDSSSGSQEDLSWLNNLGGTPAQPASQPEDLNWLNNLGGAPVSSEPAPPSQPQQEDLSWLNNLGGTPAQPASQREDLDWLNNLGGTPISSEPISAQAAPQQEDLSWLNNLGGAAAPASAQPESQTNDLDWLNNLGGTPAPAQPASQPEDLSWLNNLGSAPAQPESQTSGLDWLNNLGGTPEPSQPAQAPSAQPEQPDWLKSAEPQDVSASAPPHFSPPHTAPLSEEAARSMPDWLKSATESPAMPPLGAASKDWFASQEKTADELKFDEVQSRPSFVPSQEAPAPVDQNFFAPVSDSAALSNKEVDELFAVDMPDWLSQPEPAAGEPSQQGGVIPSVSGDELAPVELPSWVQAMRPVDAAISETSAVTADQTTEREGPLAGFHGLIPLAPIGSAQRPKAISLKIQATEEQQAGAALLEQIIASETTARPLKTARVVASQRTLRWVLSGLFIIVLLAMIGLGGQILPISAFLPAEVNNTVNVITTMPSSAPVLVVMDYEPSLAGEMEAVAGPLLDQMAVSKQPTFTFISTSPNGTALVDRLLKNAKIDQPNYVNAGYLPGGAAGARGFTEQPKTILPAVNVNLFSDFAAVIVITDQAESGSVWIEQITLAKASNLAPINQSLLIVASAQAGPMLQPYISSQQAAGMVSGLVNAARYENVNNSRPGLARSYWDAFGAGLFLAIVSMVLGSVWSLFTGMRARRSEAEQG